MEKLAKTFNYSGLLSRTWGRASYLLKLTAFFCQATWKTDSLYSQCNVNYFIFMTSNVNVCTLLIIMHLTFQGSVSDIWFSYFYHYAWINSLE